MLLFDEHLAVVPIVVNAGAAVLPALIAAGVSFVTVLFRPAEWRAKPWVPATILLAGLLVGGGIWWTGAEATPPATARGRVPAGTALAGTAGGGLGVDWTAVAIRYIDAQNRPAVQTHAGVQAPAGSRNVASTNAAGNVRQEGPFIYRADPLRSGYVGGPSPVKLKQAWKWTDAEDPFAMFCSNVAIHGQWAYGATASINPPTTSGAIFCLNTRTNQPRWPVLAQATVDGKDVGLKGIFSSPALTADGSKMLIGEGLHVDRNSALMCIDTATGQLLWRFQTPLHLESSPAIEGDVVVVGAGAVERPEDHKVAPGDNPGFVLAVRISDGKELWRFPVNDPECSPAIKDGIVYIGSGVSGNEMLALRIESDDELKEKKLERVVWRTPTPHPVLSAVTLVQDLVLFGCGDGDYIRAGKNGSVIALDRATGKIRWKSTPQDTPASVLSPIAVNGKRAIAGIGNGEVVAMDLAADGKVLWRARVTDSGSINAGCAVTDTHVYALSSDGWLAVIDLRDGKLLERTFANDPARPGELGMTFGAPIVADGRVIVGTETGGIRAYEGSGQ